MTAPVVGTIIRREAFEPAPPSYAVMSIVGICLPGVAATGVLQATLESTFPLDTPVLFNSTDAKARMFDPDSDMGVALSLINAQLARLQFSAKIIFVRVEAGQDDDETMANILGNASDLTGIHAFKKAGAVCGYYPRLVTIPKFTRTTKIGVTGFTITNGGTGYETPPTVTLPGGAGAGTGFACTAVLTGPIVTGLTITEPGDGYTPGDYTATVSGGTPDTPAVITLHVGYIANAIAAALPGVLNSYLGVAVVSSDGNSRDADVNYRETLQSERLMVCGPSVLVLDSDGNEATVDPSPALIGLFVRRDFENGGRPFRSIMNQPVYGIIGTERYVPFSQTDGAYEGQDMLFNQVGPIVRGESGDDFAIADGGFVSMGFEGTGEELIWRQIHKVRGRDFIELTVLRTLRTYYGRFNLTIQTIQAIVNTVDNVLSIAEGRQEILGGRALFADPENNADDLRTGKIYVDARFEECPVFRVAEILSRPYRPALEATIETLLASSTNV